MIMMMNYKREKQKRLDKAKRKGKSSQAPYIHMPAKIINFYMQFIYSTLEYYIFPIIDIGLAIRQANDSWSFGKNIAESLEMCKNKYYNKIFGGLNIDLLSESHLKIISVLKDYGASACLRKINTSILDEIDNQLNVRYSTIDVLNAILYLSETSRFNKEFFVELKNKYIN